MNYISKANNSFFFLIDALDVGKHEKILLSINKFFGNERINFLSSMRYFFFFSKNEIDFSSLEKNHKFIFFFIFLNKLFFKNQIKNLKILFTIEKDILNSKTLNIKIFLNFYFFFKHIVNFIFILKFISSLRFYKQCLNPVV